MTFRYDPIKANTALTPQDHMKILGFDTIEFRSDGTDWWFTVSNIVEPLPPFLEVEHEVDKR